MSKNRVWLLLGLFALVWPTLSSQASEVSLEERVKQLENLVRTQQRMLEERESVGVSKTNSVEANLEKRIAELESTVNQQNNQLAIQNVSFLDEAKPKPASTDMKVYYRDAIRFETADKRFAIKMGGRLQQDWGWGATNEDMDRITAPGSTSAGTLVAKPATINNAPRAGEHGVQHRRSRIEFEGNIYTNVIFKWQYDFANGTLGTRDAYMGLQKLPGLGRFRAGHFKEHFGLEQLTSSNHMTFMERASISDVFAPARNAGIAFDNSHLNDRIGWGIGMYKEAADASVNEDDLYAVTGRVYGTPWYVDEGKKFVHLGVAGSWRNAPNNAQRFSSRPEFRHALNSIDTGTINFNTNTKHGAVDNEHRIGTELAFNWNSASLQAEYMAGWLNRRQDSAQVADGNGLRDDLFFHGYYVQFSYFLTGESRPYKAKEGVFDRVKPKKNFWDGNTGLGAFELKARFSYIDLDDGNNADDADPFRQEYIHGGRQSAVAAGVNWYWNPGAKVMFDYTTAWINRGGPTYNADGSLNTFPRNVDGRFNGFSLRFAIMW